MSPASDSKRWHIVETWDLDQYACIFQYDALTQVYRFKIVWIATLWFDRADNDYTKPYTSMAAAELAASREVVHLLRSQPDFGVHTDHDRMVHDFTHRLVKSLMQQMVPEGASEDAY